MLAHHTIADLRALLRGAWYRAPSRNRPRATIGVHRSTVGTCSDGPSRTRANARCWDLRKDQGSGKKIKNADYAQDNAMEV